MNKKIRTSNRINRLGCGEELLYCTRVYFNARVYGGAWIPMEWFLNTIFWLLRGQKNHCKAAYLFERRWSDGQTKGKADQVGAQAPETETTGN